MDGLEPKRGRLANWPRVPGSAVTGGLSNRALFGAVAHLGERWDGIPKVVGSIPTSSTMKCRTCKAELSGKQRIFCSNICQMDQKYLEFIAAWRQGEESGNWSDGQGVSTHVRRYLHEKYGGLCSKCGWREINPVTGKCPLQVNHINGLSQDTREENLELLCPNCHSLTPTFGRLNIGRGRKRRYA